MSDEDTSNGDDGRTSITVHDDTLTELKQDKQDGVNWDRTLLNWRDAWKREQARMEG